MIFTKLIEIISKEYSIDILSQGENFEIHDIAFIDSKHDNTMKNTLYFGYDKQLNNLTSVPYQCIIGHTNSTLPTFSNLGNIAFVTEDSLFTIFNDIKALIELAPSRGIFEELTALAYKTHNIEAVIDAASTRLGNSLLFCDMSFKIIASSNSIPVVDPLWTENAKKGYCDYEFINEVKELKSIRNASPTTTAVEVTCPLSPYRKLSSKVFHNQTQIGFLLMIEGEKNIFPYHFEMLSAISNVITYTISYYELDLFEENNRYHELLYDMLIGASSKDIMPRIKELHFPSNMLVLLIRPTRYLGQQYIKKLANKTLKLQIPGTHATYHKKSIVAVIPLRKNEEMELELLELLKKLCQTEPIRIGISNPFNRIENFVNYYEQALATLELSQRLKTEESVCRYKDYQIFDLLSELKNPDKLGQFCHPALSTLRQYDHTNSSELYNTLCVFINKRCNIKLTSESLYIHRNSLVYRLNRITEICQIDFSDTNTLFLLQLSFIIDRYNGLNTSTEEG